MEKSKNELLLMPNAFKKIGLVIISLNVLFALSVKFLLAKNEFIIQNKPVLKLLSFDILLLGLLLFCLAKDKVEDERTLLFRTQSMAAAFIFGAVYTIVMPIVNIVSNELVTVADSHQIILTMLIIYLVTFTLKKKTF